MTNRTLLWALSVAASLTAACSHLPQTSGRTVRAAVVVRECLGTHADSDENRVIVHATADALRLDVNCGRRPFRIVYRKGEEKYSHYEVNSRETQTFTTEQVRELVEMRRAVAKASAERAGVKTDEQMMTALLAQSSESLSPLRDATFTPAAIGETMNGIRCRRFEMSSSGALAGEACLARAQDFGLKASDFSVFLEARDTFAGILGTNFELFDPVRTVNGVDYVIVHLGFGDGRRVVAVPALKSVALHDVPIEALDPAFISRTFED